jgi:hypothetical protein
MSKTSDWQNRVILKGELMQRPSVRDAVLERAQQISDGWDAKNTQLGLRPDEYIGVAMAYLGRATCGSRNADLDKRTMLIKAAAVLLQLVDRIDDDTVAFGAVITKRDVT